MAPRETENNAYAKFWGDKQRALWYVMVFLEWYVFYVNSSKKPNMSISFTVAFSNIFHDNFVVFFFCMEPGDILFRTVQ